MKQFKEPTPKSEYLLKVGDIFLSAGKTIIYKVIEGPVCKLYRDKDKPGTYEPWGTESSWYDTGCPIKGWRRNGPNFPSYYVEIINPDIDSNTFTSITLRWQPTKITLSEAIEIVESVSLSYRSSSSGVAEIELPLAAIKRMQDYMYLYAS